MFDLTDYPNVIASVPGDVVDIEMADNELYVLTRDGTITALEPAAHTVRGTPTRQARLDNAERLLRDRGRILVIDSNGLRTDRMTTGKPWQVDFPGSCSPQVGQRISSTVSITVVWSDSVSSVSRCTLRIIGPGVVTVFSKSRPPGGERAELDLESLRLSSGRLSRW